MPTNASGMAEQAGNSASLELLARAGLIAYGVVHLLIGWLAVQIAWSASDSKSADTSGALRTVAAQPLGKILLWLVAVGLVALALWQASEAIWGYRNREGAKRVRKQVTSGAMAVWLLIARKEGTRADYERAAFGRCLGDVFEVERSESLASGTRLCYLARTRGRPAAA